MLLNVVDFGHFFNYSIFILDKKPLAKQTYYSGEAWHCEKLLFIIMASCKSVRLLHLSYMHLPFLEIIVGWFSRDVVLERLFRLLFLVIIVNFVSINWVFHMKFEVPAVDAVWFNFSVISLASSLLFVRYVYKLIYY